MSGGHGGHGHGGHGHGAPSGSARRLAAVLVLSAVFMLAEVVGGWVSGSLALLADAGHMVSDVASLALALVAMRIGARPPTTTHSFGLRRAEVLAALANGVALFVIAGVVLVEAYERLTEPGHIDGPLMLVVACGGLAVNVIGLAVLHAGRNESLNVRGAWLHVVGDFLGSVGAVVGGACIWLWGVDWADPVVSVLIAALIGVSAVRLLRDTLHVLMEGVPSHIDPKHVMAELSGLDDVASVHDLHLWSITSGRELLTAHVVLTDGADADRVLAHLNERLHERFGIEHSTLQLERQPCGSPGCADP